MLNNLADSDTVERFFAFMRERESIRLKKLAKAPWPWTKNKILQQFSFTNVKREHDRTSQLLIKYLYKPNYDAPPEQCLINSAIARYVGTYEFMQALGWQEDYNPKHIKEVIADRMKKNLKVWTGAYIIPSMGRTGPKQNIVVDLFLTPLWENRKKLLDPWPWKEWKPFMDILMTFPGFGGSGFLAKEVTLDTRYTSFWPKQPSDRYTWTPVGPGSMRGAARVRGFTDERKLKMAETLKTCIGLFKVRGKYWPDDYVRLELTDIQFQLCEFDKMERVRLGQGRPRKTYTPRQGKLL